eukprot:5361251-Prymnesium_polylepis.2
MASRGPLGHRTGSTQRGLQPRAVRGEHSLETVGCSTSEFTEGGAAKPVAGVKPVSIVQNVSGSLLDGIRAEPHHLTGDAGDRAGSHPRRRRATISWRALALLAPPCG